METIAEDAEAEYELDKVKKKYGSLGHPVLLVQLERGSHGLGLSLAGHKDRSRMAVFVVGLNPAGAAFKTGAIHVGDEILEVNGVVLQGRCHLNASAIIKGLPGPVFKVILLRSDLAVYFDCFVLKHHGWIPQAPLGTAKRPAVRPRTRW